MLSACFGWPPAVLTAASSHGISTTTRSIVLLYNQLTVSKCPECKRKHHHKSELPRQGKTWQKQEKETEKLLKNQREWIQDTSWSCSVNSDWDPETQSHHTLTYKEWKDTQMTIVGGLRTRSTERKRDFHMHMTSGAVINQTHTHTGSLNCSDKTTNDS